MCLTVYLYVCMAVLVRVCVKPFSFVLCVTVRGVGCVYLHLHLLVHWEVQGYGLTQG